jgi:hypothetical protein
LVLAHMLLTAFSCQRIALHSNQVRDRPSNTSAVRNVMDPKTNQRMAYLSAVWLHYSLIHPSVFDNLRFRARRYLTPFAAMNYQVISLAFERLSILVI